MRAKSRRIGFLPGTDAALRFASSRIAPHGGPPISVQTCFARGREENPCLGPAPGPKNSTTMRQRAVLTAAREPQMLYVEAQHFQSPSSTWAKASLAGQGSWCVDRKIVLASGDGITSLIRSRCWSLKASWEGLLLSPLPTLKISRRASVHAGDDVLAK